MASPFTEEEERLLNWSNKQSRILTANGKANEYYIHFDENECPHTYYDELSMDDVCQKVYPVKHSTLNCCGAWTRSLFVGEWEHTDARDERTFNLQTHSFFIDLRIPFSSKILPDDITSLHQLSKQQLQFYSRRHVFGGITVKDSTTAKDDVCTRFHIMDWNFAGIPRPRPNKWHVKFQPSSNFIWREYSFVTNPNTKQYYYMEQWESFLTSSPQVTLAMTCESGILIIIDYHFNYLLWDPNITKQYQIKAKSKSMVQWIDECCVSSSEEDYRNLVQYLSSIDAAHGTIDKSTGNWNIDAAIQYWKEGSSIEPIKEILGDSFENCSIEWNNKIWKIRESSISSFTQLKSFFGAPKDSMKTNSKL